MGLANDALIRLRSQIKSIDFLIDGLSVSQMNQEVIPGKWNILQHLAHLGRYHEVFIGRIQRILQEEEPEFIRYSSEEDPDSIYWMKRPAAETLNALRHTRQELINLLEGLDPDSTLRVANHPILGTMNIHYWVEFFLLHESHHLYAIFRMKRIILNS